MPINTRRIWQHFCVIKGGNIDLALKTLKEDAHEFITATNQ